MRCRFTNSLSFCLEETNIGHSRVSPVISQQPRVVSAGAALPST